MVLTLVGSRARGTNTDSSDYDFITTNDIELPPRIKLIKNGPEYKEFEYNGRLFNIWIVEPKYYESNKILRTLDKGHFIGLANDVKRMIHGHLTFNGVSIMDRIIPIKEFINKNPVLKEKWGKYMI